MSLLCLDSWLIGQVARVETTDEIREDERGRVIVISLASNHSFYLIFNSANSPSVARSYGRAVSTSGSLKYAVYGRVGI